MKRTSRIEIRLTPEQKDMIQRAADLYGLTVSDYMRVLAMTHALALTGYDPQLQVPAVS